ncbi:MAG: hypothetical protein R3279_09980 [Putridiphycobacter sp.]|nr:hypothetical protein [Putridiphycobacter sp.]
MNIKLIFFTLFILITTVSCKKIDTPDAEAKAIFGQWQYNFDSGGFSGGGGSNLFDENSWIEFTEKGYYKVYKGSSKKEKARFTIIKNETGSFKYIVWVKGHSSYKYIVDGNKLLLAEDAADGFIYAFTRK